MTSVFVVGKEENPISDQASVRARALDRIKWAIDRAHDLEARVAVEDTRFMASARRRE